VPLIIAESCAARASMFLLFLVFSLLLRYVFFHSSRLFFQTTLAVDRWCAEGTPSTSWAESSHKDGRRVGPVGVVTL